MPEEVNRIIGDKVRDVGTCERCGCGWTKYESGAMLETHLPLCREVEDLQARVEVLESMLCP